MNEERCSDLEKLARTDEGAVRPSYGNLCIIMRHHLGEALTYDAMALAPCLNGKHIADAQVGQTREWFERMHDVSFGRDAVEQAILQISTERSAHPVRQYLESLEWDGERRIGRFLEEVLLVRPTKLWEAYIRCFFIASAARVIEPGCKFDNVLVLFGAQGLKKSTVFKKLAAPWFSDSHFDIKQRQAYLTLAAAWIYEIAEIDSVVGSREDSDIKRFFTSSEDTFVPPYGRAAVRHPRSSVIVGTTNKKRFLKDHTGNRRYWIVRTTKRPREDLLEAWREQLWAEAVALYCEGKQWWLDDELEQLQADENEEHMFQDPWQDLIAGWLPSRLPTRLLTTGEILTGALELGRERFDRAAEMRVSTIMHRLGYENTRRRVGERGDRVYVWVRSGEEVSDASVS